MSFCAHVFALAIATSPVTLASPAHAHEEDPKAALFRKDRLEISVGEQVGGFRVGPLGGVGFGATLQARHGLGPLHLVLEGAFMDLGLSEGDTSHDGAMTRLGGALQLHFARYGGRSAGFDLYVETGTGRQDIWWDEGGRLRRQDVSLGLGLRALFKLGGTSEEPRVVTVDVGVRGYVANTPARATGPACTAICDKASGPFPYDVGVFSALSVGYGW